jgi:hypothetical protein
MILVVLGGLLISVLISIGEAVYERDWPRDTFKYVLLFGLILAAALH